MECFVRVECTVFSPSLGRKGEDSINFMPSKMIPLLSSSDNILPTNEVKVFLFMYSKENPLLKLHKHYGV